MLDWLKSNNGYNVPTNEAPKYTDWLSKNGISSDLYNSYTDDVKNAIGTSYSNLYGTGEGLGSLDFLSGKNVGDYVGALGVGVGLYDNHFGMGKDIRKAELKGLNKNIELMDQKIASNKQSMADKKQFNDTWANASKNSFSGQGSGLGQIKAG